MDTLELEVVEIATNAEVIVEIDSTLSEVSVDVQNSGIIEIQPDTYVLTSDGMYTGTLTGSIPKWLIDAMQKLLTTGTGNVTDTIQGLRDMISLLEVGVNQNKTSILTANESFNALETSVVSRLNANEAAIYDVYTTKVDTTSATAIAAQVVSSTFGGNADAYIANIARSYTDAGSATATAIEQLYAAYNDISVSITSLDEVSVKQAEVYSQPEDPSLDSLITLKVGDYWIDTDHPTRQGYQWNGTSWDLASADAISKAIIWSANSSKFITDPDGNITGWAMSDSSTTESAFTIYAENFKITDGTTGYTPFRISNGIVHIGEVDTSTPQITSIGEYSSAPVATAVNQVYKNTTDGNTYLWNGTSWVLWLESGASGTDVNIVFKVSSSNTVSPTITGNSALPSGWSDGIGQAYSTTSSSTPYLWYAKGTGVSGVWTWGIPTLNTATNIAELKLYKLNDTTMSTAGSYNFGTATLSGYESGWTMSVPTLVNNGDKIYVTTAVVTGAKDSVVVPSWSTPVVYAQRTDGTAGATGVRGAVSVFKTFTSTPTTTDLNNAIYAVVTDGIVRNGDNVTYTISGVSGGTKQAYYMNGWTTNVQLYVHGDAVISGTLAADKIQAGLLTGHRGEFRSTTGTVQSTVTGIGLTSVVDVATTTASIGLASRGKYYGIAGECTTNSGEGSSAGVIGWGDTYGTIGVFGTSSNQIGVYGRSGTHAIKGYSTDASGQWGLITYQKCYAAGGFSPFTGSHIVYSKDTELSVGDIVVSDDAWCINIDQTLVHVSRSNTPVNKKVIGVVSSKQQDVLANIRNNLELCDFVENDYGGINIIGIKEIYKPYIDRLVNESYIEVETNSVGEGGINVCSFNGDIENGDYITSSVIVGKGIKQDDDILHNYTVAKALENVYWDTEVIGTNGCFEYMGYKCKMIACTYHCG